MCIKKLYKCAFAGFAGMLMLVSLSCEKEYSNVVLPERPQVGIDPDDPPQNYQYNRFSSEAKLRDSVYLYTYYFYLWQDQLPRSFATQNYRTAESLLEALKGYSKGPNGMPLDRYSFLDREGTISQELQEGNVGSFGFDVRYFTETDLYVKLVDENSPAYLAGIRRGWVVTEINNVRDLSLASMEKDDFEFLFKALNAPSISLKLRNPLGNEVSVNLQRTIYGYRPIIASRIFEKGGKKAGYFAFGTFVSNELIKAQLDGIMSGFAAAGVKDLIIDLRYNGGGDVSTANYITDLVAPVSAHSKLMNYYIINNQLMGEGWQYFIFTPTYFFKENTLELNNIYFLVTNGTASASELLINNLKPYMNIKLIGDDKTYGKPVGYFAWDILGVDLYAVSFQTQNANHSGDFFDGMPVDKKVRDDLSRELGDPAEWMTAEALYHIEHGSFSVTGPGSMTMSLGRQVSPGIREGMNARLDSRSRKDMYDFRKVPAPPVK